MTKNMVASECCGSCEHWDDNHQLCTEHNEFAQGSHFSCEGEDYLPRNPIPITDVPGVKELVREAYLEGYDVGRDRWWLDDKGEGELAKYIKAMEAKDE